MAFLAEMTKKIENYDRPTEGPTGHRSGQTTDKPTDGHEGSQGSSNKVKKTFRLDIFLPYRVFTETVFTETARDQNLFLN